MFRYLPHLGGPLVWTFTTVAVTRAKPCDDERWQTLKEALLDAEVNAEEYGGSFSPHVLAQTQASHEWFKENYQDCVEGFLSMILYMSLHNHAIRGLLLDLADKTARELNPLALRSGRSTWPFFGQLGELHLIWQNGDRAAPLNADPSLPASASGHVPAVITPILTAFKAPFGNRRLSSLHLAHGMRQGAIMIDAGVFDGTDWTVAGVQAGAIVLGFEPIAKNMRLFQERFPVVLAQEFPEAAMAMASKPQCSFHTFLQVTPGEHAPRQKWSDIFHAQDRCFSSSMASKVGGFGHAYIFGAALGEQVQGLNMTTRYDYSSVADSGYLKGPKDMDVEQVAMTTLDAVFDMYLSLGEWNSSAFIDVLKVDVEGYELGVLRGAERLLSLGRVHYIMMEFNPGMLGTTGTDPHGLLSFVQHYGFLCHSFRIDRPLSFRNFVRRYTENSDMLPVQGLGELEDLVCENLWWNPEKHEL